MASTIIIPRKTKVSLPVPSSFVGKQVFVTFDVIEEKPKTATRLSDKFRGVLSKNSAKNFIQHTKKMREEWDNI
ncbi:MAG: hypothetical protein LBE36_05845 [Flavobacteriaceae bacterium]|jgi:hypothetical protein|nr:hypothetical protein [Flavobacteriaceae bacterium]